MGRWRGKMERDHCSMNWIITRMDLLIIDQSHPQCCISKYRWTYHNWEKYHFVVYKSVLINIVLRTLVLNVLCICCSIMYIILLLWSIITSSLQHLNCDSEGRSIQKSKVNQSHFTFLLDVVKFYKIHI